MLIREAKPEDAGEWSRMRTQLWPDTPDAHRAEIAAFFAGTSNDIVEVFVIEVAPNKLAGFIELNIRSFAEGSVQPEVPYVEGWYIDAEYQAQGYGKALMLKAEQWAKARGYGELASDVELDNEHSIAVHQHFGFKEIYRIVCFLKKLD